MEPPSPFLFESWFRARFGAVVGEFEGRRHVMDEVEQDHDEARSLRKSRGRYRDTLRLLLPELERPQGLRLLDVGGGQVAWLAADRFCGRVRAADLGGAFRAESRRLGVPLDLWDLARDEPPYEPASFDVVVLTEVLEHLPPPPHPHLRRVARLLQPGGVLLLSVPNLAALTKRVKFLFGRSPLKLGERYHERSGYPDHLREYTLAEVRRFLPACGFVIERVRTGSYGHGGWRRAATALCRLAPGLGRTILVRARRRGRD